MGGICAVYSPHKNCIFDLLRATQRLQHLGQEWSGVAISKNNIITYVIKPTIVREGFPLLDVANKKDGEYRPKEKFEGSAGIGCTSVSDKQPMCLSSNFGQFALAFDGRILNFEELKQELIKEGHVFYRGNETEVMIKLLARGKDVVEGIKIMNSKIRGSFSIVVLNKDEVYAAKCPLGVNPLQIGEKEGKTIVASETDAIVRGSANFVREVKPGEILKLSNVGFETVGQMESKRRAHCAFRWFYTARADAFLEGVSSDEVRKRVGAWHAKKDQEDGIKLDFIAGMPMSGTSYAIGYSHEINVPYDEAFLYDRYSQRSYIPPTQEDRDRIADEKVTVMRHTVKGKKIGLTDDSIVRGTVLKHKIAALKKAGAKEVHIRIGFPPLIDKCLLNVSTKGRDELAVYKHGDIEKVRKHLGADSLRYTPINVAIDAITQGTDLTADDLCIFCITSEDPTE